MLNMFEVILKILGPVIFTRRDMDNLSQTLT